MNLFYMSKCVELMVNSRVVIDPWFSNIDKDIPDHLQSELQQAIKKLANDWKVNDWKYSDEVWESIIYLTFVTTLSFERVYSDTPFTHWDAKVIDKTYEKIQHFLEYQGTEPLLYTAGAAWMRDLFRFLSFYGSVTEDEILNRAPFHPRLLSFRKAQIDDLAKIGYIYRMLDEDHHVEITLSGQELLKELKNILKHTGYDDLFQKYHLERGFNGLDWDEVTKLHAPGFAEIRSQFLDFAGIQPGMNVLEIGCGTGTVTIGARLYDRVLPGTVTCIDTGEEMLKKLDRKLQHLSINNVSTFVAQAEELPFPNGKFDAVIGYLSFNLTDQQKSLAEFKRVLKPGGIIAMAVPGRRSSVAPAYLDMFQPLFEINKQNKESTSFERILVDEDQAKDLFSKFKLDEIYIQHQTDKGSFVSADLVIQNQLPISYGTLIQIPYERCEELKQEIYKRSENFLEKYTLEQRQWSMDMLFVRGIV